MPVKSIGEYDFPSRSRQELYGDDQLVNLWWRDNPWFASAACFRAPKAMTWGDFRATMVDPWASADPDYDPKAAFRWTIDDEPVSPDDAQTLEGLGVGHKSLVAFRT
jgi:phenol/toluene 2-monooxygenase (NADH) P4/A4